MLYGASEIVGTLAPSFGAGLSPGHQIPQSGTQRGKGVGR